MRYLFAPMKNVNTIKSAVVILTIASVMFLASTMIMTNMPKALATTEVVSATLSGDKEVPPVKINATGSAGFSQPHFGNMSYGIQLSDIEKVTAAHIHQGKEGKNGPVIVTLFKADNSTGTGPVKAIDMCDARILGKLNQYIRQVH